MPKWRPFTWIILVINVLFLIWIIAGSAGASGDATDCGSLDQETCNAAEDIGTGIGVFLIIVLWGFVDLILGVLWLVTRSKRRDCPACGEKMAKKSPLCANCGFDYRNLQSRPVASPGQPPAG